MCEREVEFKSTWKSQGKRTEEERSQQKTEPSEGQERKTWKQSSTPPGPAPGGTGSFAGPSSLWRRGPRGSPTPFRPPPPPPAAEEGRDLSETEERNTKRGGREGERVRERVRENLSLLRVLAQTEVQVGARLNDATQGGGQHTFLGDGVHQRDHQVALRQPVHRQGALVEERHLRAVR